MKKSFIALLVLCLTHILSLCAEQTTIQVWHAFDGQLEEVFQDIVHKFNKGSKNIQVSLTRKGHYIQTFQQGIEAAEKKQGPHLLQVYEIGTQIMACKKHLYVPVHDLLKRYAIHFDPADYMDSIRWFYSTNDGKMLSFPWNSSVGVLFYNKTLFKQAGLDPEKAPETWEELEATCRILLEHGIKGFTTSWPVAYHLEYVCCLHNIPFATHSNGFDSMKARLIFNNGPMIRHVEKLVEWAKSGIFVYGGRDNGVEQAFTSGKCAIFFQGASRLPNIKKRANFEIGVGPLPYWKHLVNKPYNLTIGGASFWVLSGFKDNEYRAIAEFLSYLSRPDIQADWHQRTYYLPITKKACDITQAQGFYEANKVAKEVIDQVLRRSATANTRGVRLGDYVNIRNVINDCLEKAFSGTWSAEYSLDKAVEEGNLLLEEFEKENK